MRHISVLPYYFPDALLRLSGSGNAASEGLFMLGAAAGFLILCSLLRLWIYGNLDRKALPPREYRCRMAAVFSILAAALGLCVPFFPGFAGITVPAGSMIQFLGLLGFELSLGLLLLIRQFPLWGWRQLLPLPLLCAAALLLPLWGLRAPLSLGGFSLVLCLLCVSLFAWLVKQGQNGRPFFQGILIFLPLGLSFVLPLGRGAFFWPAAFLAYLLLEHRFLPGGASSSTPLFLPPPLTVTVEGVSAGRPKTRSPSPAAGKGSVRKAPVQKSSAQKAPVKKTPAKKSSAAPSIKTNKTKSAAGAKAAKAKPAAKTKSSAITKNAAKTKTAPASVKAKPAAAGRTGTKTAAGAKRAAKTKTAASVKAKPAAAPKPAAAAMAAKKPETVEELTELT
ncbi:MAG: hypothetical protein LBD09_02165, partial [Treponema sp.]|nr:hypothetical protein [Treponema sp.]